MVFLLLLSYKLRCKQKQYVCSLPGSPTLQSLFNFHWWADPPTGEPALPAGNEPLAATPRGT
eukprot:3449814-Pyramimonas_sp.AAC.1